MLLSGKVALVAGGATGIGAAIALTFHREGAAVVVTGIGESLVAARKAMPGIDVIDLELRDTAAVFSAMERIAHRHRAIDILVLSAGEAEFSPIELVDEDFFDRQFDINVRGSYFTVKHALPLMPEGGSIIFAWSVAPAACAPGTTVYAATRASVRSLSQHLATELAPRRIRVNTVAPNDCIAPSTEWHGVPWHVSQDEHARDFAAAALFLANDASARITGGELAINHDRRLS